MKQYIVKSLTGTYRLMDLVLTIDMTDDEFEAISDLQPGQSLTTAQYGYKVTRKGDTPNEGTKT